MMLAACKTKIICTIGPASATPEIMMRMLDAGMNVARLNYSYGDVALHKVVIENLRRAALAAHKPLAIMADLPGPKIRIGKLAQEMIALVRGHTMTLTTDDIVGDPQRVSVNFSRLPAVVKPGDTMFLNDGGIQLGVENVEGSDVHCRVLIGGELRSGKGLNLPGIDLGVGAFTEHDHDCLKSALENGVDAVSQSFVGESADVDAVRKAAADLGHHPFLIAKIERAGALDHIDEILRASDGMMIARGDLGVEIPLEEIAVVQKQLIRKANLLGKPVIIATQMLESMVDHGRPTRAESTDVANAILDGADCVMLSEESAMGKYPVEAVDMLAAIAKATEPHRLAGRLHEVFADYDRDHKVPLVNLISHNVQQTVEHLTPAAVIVSTNTGYTARMISRFKLPVWIAAVSRDEETCQGLQFSYGVHSIHEPKQPEDWNEFARRWVQSQGLTKGLVVLTEGPSPDNPKANHRLEVIDLSQDASKPEAKSEPKPDAKVEPKPDAKVEPKPDAKVEPKPDAKVEPKPEAKVEPKPEAKVEPKPEAKVEPKPEAKVEPKPEAKIEPKPEAKVEPKPEAKIEPKPEAKIEPKPEAKIEPKPDAKPEAKADGMQETEVANSSDGTATDQDKKLKRAAVMDAALERLSARL